MTKNDNVDAIMKYVMDNSLRLHPAQQKIIQATRKLPFGMLMSSADQMQLLHNLAHNIGARRAIDVGMFTGYSALSIALALPPDGKLYTCDTSDAHLDIASDAWKMAGVNNIIEFRKGPGTNTMRCLLQEEGAGKFDFIYIDAQKHDYDDQYELALKLLRPKGIVAFDNVLWSGAVANPARNDDDTVVLRKFNAKVAKDPRINVSMLTTGDGTTICFKL